MRTKPRLSCLTARQPKRTTRSSRCLGRPSAPGRHAAAHAREEWRAEAAARSLRPAGVPRPPPAAVAALMPHDGHARTQNRMRAGWLGGAVPGWQGPYVRACVHACMLAWQATPCRQPWLRCAARHGRASPMPWCPPFPGALHSGCCLRRPQGNRPGLRRGQLAPVSRVGLLPNLRGVPPPSLARPGACH